MNVRVEVGPLTIDVVAIVNEPVVSARVEILSGCVAALTWTCFTLTPISINGHSLNAINPDFIEVGELATSALA